MQALVDSHIFVNHLNPKELFRAAYLVKFNRPITDLALAVDVDDYLVQGKIPPYVVDHMIRTYGVH